ncbi:MAG: cytochrome C oxidase subunit IV family protein [candidate division KSB1 bacterium]|nr:cytochrome C oxidase subunit IV family protein [candidate division KSB1 bacterium]
MSGTHQEPNYMRVFYSLFILTVLEVGVAYINVIWKGFPLVILGVALIILALAKATLVAMYFMHLKFEKRALGIIAMTPLILCTLLILALLPDLTGASHKAAVNRVAVEQGEADSATEQP